MQARPMLSRGVRLAVCLSVRLSVTFVNYVKTSNRSLSSKLSGRRVVKPNVMAIFRRGSTPLTGATNADGVGTNRDSGRIAGYRSMTAAVRDQQLTVVGAAVYKSYGARLFTAQTATLVAKTRKSRKQNNFIVRSGKSEAEVTNNRRLRLRYCTSEANYTDEHEASRELSATAELFVFIYCYTTEKKLISLS